MSWKQSWMDLWVTLNNFFRIARVSTSETESLARASDISFHLASVHSQKSNNRKANQELLAKRSEWKCIAQIFRHFHVCGLIFCCFFVFLRVFRFIFCLPLGQCRSFWWTSEWEIYSRLLMWRYRKEIIDSIFIWNCPLLMRAKFLCGNSGEQSLSALLW